MGTRVGTLLVTVLLAARPAAAQETSMAVAAGAFAFDLSGTGTAPMVAVRLDRELHRDLRVEGGLVVARPGQQFGETTTFLAPEVQLQWVPVRLFRGDESRHRLLPYLGLGTGWAYDVRPRLPDRNDITFNGALGVRLPMGASGNQGLEVEFRVRYLETGFTGSSGDFTLGWYWGV